MPVIPTSTPRLRLRMLNAGDLETVTRYRADESVAKYQDWHLPYTADMARASLDRQAGRVDVTDGEWVSIAIERAGETGGEVVGEVVGDVAVGLSVGSTIATIGYTLAAEHHGRGYASEAVGAVIDALFEHTTVHRIVASLDPENHASLRLLEQLGFTVEGTARSAELIRGEWVDDMRCGLLRDERIAWLSRDRSRPEHVELIELDANSDTPYRRLRTHHFQERFVSPVIRSLADAMLPDIINGAAVQPWFRGIAADGAAVGFVMIAEASAHHPDPYLWRLLIDRMHQRRGIGSMVLDQLIARLRAEGHQRLVVSWVDAPGGPRPLYERYGFLPTGEIDDGEVVAALSLR